MRNKVIPLTDMIESGVENVPGWSPIDQLTALATLTISSAHLQGDVVELGSWCGRSAVALGIAAKIAGNSQVYCIDLFPKKSDWYRNDDGTYSLSVKIRNKTIMAYDEQTVWEKPFKKDIAPLYKRHKSVFDIFKQTIKNNNLNKFVKPFRGDLAMFLAHVPVKFKCRMAFIDAHHGYESVCDDIKRIVPHMVKGAWICFDDAFTSYEGVNRAITEKIIESKVFDQCHQVTRKLFVARKKS